MNPLWTVSLLAALVGLFIILLERKPTKISAFRDGGASDVSFGEHPRQTPAVTRLMSGK